MPRLDAFLADLAKSGLVAPDELQKSLASTPPAPEPDAALNLARALVLHRKLTPYQAGKVLNGATKGFFLGDYRILRPLGEGGMGKVYLASRKDSADLVAIKVLPPKRAQEEAQALKRFRREMELSQRVRHSNLARTLDVGQQDEVHFMVLEYIPGQTLYDAVKQEPGGPLRVTDCARLFLKVVDGLEAAHQGGLVHRDIKPSNIMITPDGNALVLDLGLARATEDDKPLTKPNVVIGTLDYASPEQLVNASSADRRSDLYSLGCTIYFTLAGRAPFEGGDLVNKIFKQRMEDPELLEKVARGVPSAFAAIVRKLMAKDPDDRYQSCAELRPDLARWTDPAKVRAILGTEAEVARAFKPPPPEIDDIDLRLLADEWDEGHSLSIRDLGAAEPASAPMHRPVPPPVRAVVVPQGDRRAPPATTPSSTDRDDNRWLIQFIVAAVIVGLLAILAITLFA